MLERRRRLKALAGPFIRLFGQPAVSVGQRGHFDRRSCRSGRTHEFALRRCFESRIAVPVHRSSHALVLRLCFETGGERVAGQQSAALNRYIRSLFLQLSKLRRSERDQDLNLNFLPRPVPGPGAGHAVPHPRQDHRVAHHGGGGHPHALYHWPIVRGACHRCPHIQFDLPHIRLDLPHTTDCSRSGRLICGVAMNVGWVPGENL